MAVYIAIFMGGTPDRLPLVGWVGETVGARWTIPLGGIVAVLVGLVGLVLAPRVPLRRPQPGAGPHPAAGPAVAAGRVVT